jgi:hypothetical protein
MSNFTNALFLILLLSFMSGTQKNKMKTTHAINTKHFYEIVEIWKGLWKDVHNVSDKIFNSATHGEYTMSGEVLKKTWQNIFHKFIEVSNQIPQEQINFWALPLDQNPSVVDRILFYKWIQNGVNYGIQASIYTSSGVTADGEYGVELQEIINGIVNFYIKFENLTKEVFLAADENGDQVIDFEEFKIAFEPLLDVEDSKTVFNSADFDGNGLLDAMEVSYALTKIISRHNPYFIISDHQKSASSHEQIRNEDLNSGFLQKKKSQNTNLALI